VNEDDRAKQIAEWAVSKPYFREVAPTMERLIEADPQLACQDRIEGGFIGYVDKAYDAACWMTPRIRSQMLAAEERRSQDAAHLDALGRDQEGPEPARRSIERAIQHVKDNPPPKPAPVKKVRPQPSPEFWKREKRWEPWE
jgi:hypothetical protein